MLWKAESNARLDTTLPSSETFMVKSYSRGRIFASVWSKTEFHLSDANTPLNVELRAFIESHFKCTIMNVKLIFRLGFGVKSQNLWGRGLHRRASDPLDFSDKKTPQYFNFRGCIELHDWKGI